jgi:hypothetical protein
MMVLLIRRITMKLTPIKNGNCRSNVGEKHLVFLPNRDLRPVLYAVYSGYQPDRGTVQGAEVGDIIASVKWGKLYQDYIISIHGGGRLTPTEEGKMWILLKKEHPWIDAFLEPSGRGGCFIPDTVIPEHEYLSVRGKRSRLDRFIKRYKIPYNVDTFMNAPKNGLNLEPRPLDIDLDTYQPSEKSWSGSAVSIKTFETWYGSSGNGRNPRPLDIDPTVESGSNYAHTDTYNREGSPGIIGWEHHKFVIRVGHGVYTRDHCSYGHTIDIWEVVKP